MQQILKNSVWLAVVGAVCFGAACQPTATTNTNVNATVINTNSNANANVMNTNTMNANVAVVNSNTAETSGAGIETKEPEQYQAVVSLKIEMAGAANAATPPLKANVARNGADRRMEFSLPNGDKIVYLDLGGKQFIIAPNRKEYAELNKESIGIDPRRLLMPEQIVNQVKNLKGVEKVGEEKVGTRDAIKYRYGGTTDTKSQAGTVQTESIVLVDKETGLPLRSVTNAESQNGVQGVKGLNFVTEMSDLKTTVDASLFKEPTDFKKVAPEEIKSQANMLFGAAAALLGQLMQTAKP
ncbi:MAG: hypothetical protein M3T96_09180 [Acidobacteriota bacterium]|nr:hypothetical protein [Acidobacteriota bacterium]